MPANIHWFCDSGALIEPNSSSNPLLQSLDLRREQAAECLLLYTYDDAQEYQHSLTSGVDRELGRCDLCVEEYYKARQRLREKLAHDYDSDDVLTVERQINEQDFKRINRGLDKAASILDALEPSERTKDRLDIFTQLAIFEALCNDVFVQDENALNEHFQSPFTMVQSRKRLNIARFAPAATAFLFDPDEARRQWATQTWNRYRRPPTKEQFEYAIKGPLARHLQSIASFVPDEKSLERTWYGIGLIVNNLDEELVAHSLRALEVDVFKLALDHFRFEVPSFRYVVETIQKLLEIAPRVFWDSMGTISPTTFTEQIFNNAQYDRIMEQASVNDVTEASALKDLLSWIKPFIVSLDTAHQAGVCRSLTFQLLQRLQSNRFPDYVRAECFRTGLATLTWTLNGIDSATSANSTGRTITNDVLEVVGEYIPDIVKISSPSQPTFLDASCSELSLRVIKLALALDCNRLRSDRLALTQVEDLKDLPGGYGSFVAPLWDIVAQNTKPENLELVKATLSGLNDLMGFEKIKVDPEDAKAKDKSAYNVKLGRWTQIMCRILERISDFSTHNLDQLFKSPGSAKTLISSLFSADPDLFDAGVSIMKSLSAEPARREAMGHLLLDYPDTILNAVSFSIHQIARNKSYVPCSRMLKTSSDIIDGLCNPNSGLLRVSKLVEDVHRKAIEGFWQHQWACLRMIYEKTDEWGRKKADDHSSLKEFCRDTMQFSEMLFDQYSLFANATRNHDQDQGSNGSKSVDLELLKFPATTMSPMVKWLRLRDLFLMEISVTLVKKLLNRLTELKQTIEDGASNILEQIVTGGPLGRTHLTGQAKAEIARALEANLGRSIDQSIDIDSETASDRPPFASNDRPAIKSKNKSSIIDPKSWKASTKDSSATAAKNILEQEEKRSSLDKHIRTKGDESDSAQEIRNRQASWAARRSHVKDLEKQSRGISKTLRPGPTEVNSTSFREKREQEKEAKRTRDLERIAFIKKQAGVGGSADDGSSLKSIGIKGKEHGTQGPSMMVSSASESDSETEGDMEAELFGSTKLPKGSEVVRSYQLAKAQARKGPVKKQRVLRSAKDMRARLAPDLTSLHKDILSWDFFHEGPFPPSSARRDYQLVTNTFKTPLDYQSTFEPLLLLEAWQSFLHAREDGTFRCFELKVASRMNVDSFLELSASMTLADIRDIGIGEADIVLLSKGKSPSNDRGEPHCFARVWKTDKAGKKKATPEVTLRANVGNELASFMNPGVTIYCVKIQSITPLEREYGALLGLKYFDLCDEITRARPSPLLNYSAQQLAAFQEVYKINTAQSKAVKSAIDNDAFTLIQGPPGSGKTKTIVAIVGALLTANLEERGRMLAVPRATESQNGGYAAKKLLVCAPSNAAVDELVMRFKQGVTTLRGEEKKLSIIRLGRSDAISSSVMDVTLEELVNAKLNLSQNGANRSNEDVGALMNSHKNTCEEYNELRNVIDSLKASGKPVSAEQSQRLETLKRKKIQISGQIDNARDRSHAAARDAEINRRKVQQEILDGAHVICATLSGSGHEMFQNLNIEFETVIIDEAAQSIELSALIPLKYGCSKCILVGDPKQLPPTVLSREAARFQYEQSLFVRMQENHPEDVHLLDTQYRMHPDISAFPSQAFYSGRLVDGPHMSRLRTKPWHTSTVLSPYRFFDVHGFHQNAPRGHSLINVAEIDVALKLYNRLITDYKGYDFAGKIGIITPYKSQLKELRSRFSKRHGESVLTTVEFNTTDAFQGRESEIIIFSCVRASGVRGIGFLSDIRRMNVGITRAKSSLWVLGNSQSLTQGEFWGRLIDDAKGRNVYSTGDLSALLQKPLLEIRKEADVEQKLIKKEDSHAFEEHTDKRALYSRPTMTSSLAEDPRQHRAKYQDAGPSPRQPSGGRNGLNTNLNCDLCGSFAHGTRHCDNTEALEGVRGQCHRCGQSGHVQASCKVEKCLSCGEVGHRQQRCSSTKTLSERDRSFLQQKEEQHAKTLAVKTEWQRKAQLGDHNLQVPPVLPNPEEPKKRKRNASPPSDAPKGPRLALPTTAQANRMNGLDAEGPNGVTAGPVKVIRHGDAHHHNHALPARPPSLAQTNVKPLKKKKPVDPFIRPKHR